MSRKVLHLLCQRPTLTGSGITLDALVRHAAEAGWQQMAVVGVPANDPAPAVGGLPAARVRPLVFGLDELPFPVPGMSDVMPYPSTRFSAMTLAQLAAYNASWRRHLERVFAEFQPDLIHTHHVWLLSSWLEEIAPDIPVVTHCHATGLRQLSLCPRLADEVIGGCSRNDRFLVLQQGQRAELAAVLGVPLKRIRVAGAGYRADLFHARGRAANAGNRLLYIGKYSAAKGLPSLLDAVKRLAKHLPDLELHVAGSGAGPEAEALNRRMEEMAPLVTRHGQLDQPALANLMRRCAVAVLPSFYEGVPLVLVEALACGCRLVATRLPGVLEELAPHLGAALELVPLPRLTGVDRPVPEDLPAFVDDLTAAIATALSGLALDDPTGTMAGALTPFTWNAVFRRVETVWRELLGC